ncbi:hypothetical protein [Nocardia sp. NPDC051570]|uniref:hypothetical protein n=1 Tax=Nocardia sp. NPDC051570 TaxID=3364324 RepID=UPI0037A28714
MSNPGQELSAEPQSERGAMGSRDTGSGTPGGGPADRPVGAIDDKSVPSHGEPGDSANYASAGTLPPQDTKPAVPPYEGRKESADVAAERPGAGARTGGAAGPVADSDYKAPRPGATPGGATASPADEQPASESPETQRDTDQVGPAHVSGTGRAEDKI